jgi:hypothetical protein
VVEEQVYIEGLPVLPSGYPELLQELKGRIRTAQVRAGR